MKKTHAFVVLVLAFLVSTCSGLATAPTPVPPGTPTSGTINIVYDRTAAGVTRCLSAGMQWDRCGSPVKVTGDSNGLAGGWPDRPSGLHMEATGSGTFTATATAPTTPPPQQLGIYVIDPWLCPPVQICEVVTGRGISINGTRLKDGERRAYFSFVPPTVYP